MSIGGLLSGSDAALPHCSGRLMDNRDGVLASLEIRVVFFLPFPVGKNREISLIIGYCW